MNTFSKRNYILMFVDVILFVNAMTFLSINTVIPYFLNSLGANTFQISLASALVSIGAFISQPIFSKMAMDLTYKRNTFVRILSLQRLMFLAFVFTIPLFAKSNPHLMIIVFLVCWGIFNFFTGSYSPFYFGLFSKMIPESQRGRMIGFSGATANLIALGTAYAVGIMLDKIAFPINYALILGLGVLLLLLDNVDFMLMKEPPDTHEGEKISYLQYIKAVPEILKNNKIFVKLITGYSFFVISNISLAYYSLYAMRKFNAGAEDIALFMVITIIVNTLGNITFGLISDRYGHKLVLQIASACAVLAGLLILSVNSIFSVYAAFVFSSLGACGYFLSGNILIIQNSPGKQMPVYIGINVMITLVISAVVTLVSSFIIDAFSFMPVFFMTGAAGLGAFIIFYTLKKANAEQE